MRKKVAPKRIVRRPETMNANQTGKEKEAKNASNKKSEGIEKQQSSNEKSKQTKYRKCYVNTRCSPHLLATLSQKILEAQRREVRSMGFGALLDIPNCTSNHDLLLALANAYEPSTYCLLTPIGKIDVTWESVTAVLNVPSYGDPFLEKTKAPEAYDAIKKKFNKKTSTQLIDIMMENTNGGRTFRQAYLLYALSNFLMPLNSTAVRENILPFIIDVDEPGKYNWIRPIFDSLVEGLTNFKKGLVQSLNGCVYVLQILYFHKQQYGPFNFGREPRPPWIAYWTAEKILNQIALERNSKAGIIKPRNKQPVPERPIRPKKRAEKKEKLKIEEERVAESPDKNNGNLKQEEEKIETKRRRMEHENSLDKRTEKKEKLKFEEKRVAESPDKNNDNLKQEEEEKIDEGKYVESKVNESPLNPSIPSFDLHFDSPTPETSTVELKVDLDKLYEWVMDRWEDKEEIVASLRGKRNVFLKRTNARTLRPRQQIDNLLLALYKDGEDEVVAGKTAEDPKHFRYNPPNFDKLKLQGKKLVFLPFCYKGHWSLFALDVPNNKFYILDSLFNHAVFENINKYAANYVVNILTLADPGYSPTPSGPTIEFLEMPKQPNKYDCGLFVMKWMKMWEPSREMPRWSNEECGEFSKRLIWKMLFTPENIERNKTLKICEDYKVRGKKKQKKEELHTPEVAKPEAKVLRERKPAASQMTPYATIGTKTLERVIARQDRPKLQTRRGGKS